MADKTRQKVIGYLEVIPNNPYSITKRTVTAGTHVFSFAGDEKHGILARLGYKVGFDGLSRAHRRDILDFAFENALPPTTSAEYMAEWGPKRSEKGFGSWPIVYPPLLRMLEITQAAIINLRLIIGSKIFIT